MLPDSHWEVKLASVVWQPLDQGDSHGGVRSHQIQDLLGLVRERGVTADSRVVAWAAGGMELPLTEMEEDHQWNNFEGRAVWSSHERSGLDWSTCNTHCLYNFRRGRKELMVKIMEVLIVWQWPQGRKHFKGSGDVAVIDLFWEVKYSPIGDLRVTCIISQWGLVVTLHFRFFLLGEVTNVSLKL